MATEELNKPSSLPPYPEMIMKAIEAVGDTGANKSAISNYIESTYGDVPAGHTTLLTHHLNQMKDSGEIVFFKNNYMKPDPNAPPKRGRGRPPKPKDPNAPEVTTAALGPPRPRGRPPKDPNAPPKPPSEKVSSGRPRGRPKKIARSEAASTPGSTGRPRGRPPKVKPQMTEVSVEQ
ncbi:HMG-Y-related protein A-like [Lotus japonicus]|uniref:HMG-Y-related protein A-like n=1 Tax=Lotus japonicus TaxID=34305 RepID=UPI002582CA81|nr:HMG-Y-related protein A-like [Lotus japonicus]